MSQLPEQHDLLGRVIKQGNWIVQTYMHGSSPSLKISYVMGFAKSGVIRLLGYQQKHQWVNGVRSPIPEWEQNGPYTMSNSNRTYVILADDLPLELLQTHNALQAKVDTI